MKDRSQEMCYWESQPGGCSKSHCPFLHKQKVAPAKVVPAKVTPVAMPGRVPATARMGLNSLPPGVPITAPTLRQTPKQNVAMLGNRLGRPRQGGADGAGPAVKTHAAPQHGGISLETLRKKTTDQDGSKCELENPSITFA